MRSEARRMERIGEALLKESEKKSEELVDYRPLLYHVRRIVIGAARREKGGEGERAERDLMEETERVNLDTRAIVIVRNKIIATLPLLRSLYSSLRIIDGPPSPDAAPSAIVDIERELCARTGHVSPSNASFPSNFCISPELKTH